MLCLTNTCRVGNQKERERRPRSPATHVGSLKDFVGEEAPEARRGPRSPDALYRGEEAVAVLKSLHTDKNEMQHLGNFRWLTSIQATPVAVKK